MRHYISLLVLIFSASALAEQNIDRTLQVSKDGTIRIETINGDMRILSWDKAEINVVGELSDEDELIVKTENGRSLVAVEQKSSYVGRRNWNADESHLTVYVPQASELQIAGESTDFEVQGVLGGLVIEVVSGDISLSGIDSKLDIETVSGDVEIVDSIADIHIETISGDIEVDVEATDFDAASISGDVEASIQQSDNVDIESVSGDIELELMLNASGRMDIETVSGDVDINFYNKDMDARFDIETGPGGEIQNNLSSDVADASFIGSEKIRFQLGSGSGTINIDTMSGTIVVE